MSEARFARWLVQYDYAHRGLHGSGIPENSLAAAEAAIEQGLGIECDVQMSRDEVPMVFHDWDLERLTPGAGRVADHDARELEALPLAETDQRLVSLYHFIRFVNGRVPVLIEIKSQPGFEPRPALEAVTRTVATCPGPLALMSFDPRICGWLAKNAPQITRGLVGTDSYRNGFEGMWRNETILEEVQPDFLAVDRRDLERPEAHNWRARKRPLLTWTIRNPQERVAAQALADALIAEEEGLP